MEIHINFIYIDKYKNLQWVTLDKELFHKEDEINIFIKDLATVLH